MGKVTDDDLKEGSYVLDTRVPVILQLSLTEKDYLQTVRVQMALAEYGGQYESQEGCKTHGRAQVAMKGKNGLPMIGILAASEVEMFLFDRSISFTQALQQLGEKLMRRMCSTRSWRQTVRRPRP